MRALCLARHAFCLWRVVWCQDAGAIPYCKTNVPQLLMLPESTNHIFGPALNPWDTKRSPGGSSGGTHAPPISRWIACSERSIS